MEKTEIESSLKNIKSAIDSINNKESKYFFFTADSKGTPVGSLNYIYELAYQMKEMGYDVRMLYADSEGEFIGVGSWLGEKYAQLPHFNTAKDNISVSACDFLFIPEVFSNLMAKTKSMPCKRIVILENFSLMTENIELGANWLDYGISDCITTSEMLKQRVVNYMPFINVQVIRPYINTEIFHPEDNKQLIVNIIAKNREDVTEFVKLFKWKYSIYNFLTFRCIYGRPQQEMSECLNNALATVWIDADSNNGYSALQAMASGNIIIGKYPEYELPWMVNEDGSPRSNGLWFYKIHEGIDALAAVVESYIEDNIPTQIYDSMNETIDYFSLANVRADIENIMTKTIDKRLRDLNEMSERINNTLKTIDEEK